MTTAIAAPRPAAEQSTAEGPPPAVRVTDLAKVYGNDVHAVRGVSFEVARGEIFGLLGPNGAGKSTTIGVLTGLVRPTDGSAAIAGFDVRRQPLEARRASAVVFQTRPSTTNSPVARTSRSTPASGASPATTHAPRSIGSSPRSISPDSSTAP